MRMLSKKKLFASLFENIAMYKYLRHIFYINFSILVYLFKESHIFLNPRLKTLSLKSCARWQIRSLSKVLPK